MVALLAVLGIFLVGPTMIGVPTQRLTRRLRAAGVKRGDRAGGKALVRPGEALSVVAGVAVLAASLLALAVLAVLE